MRHILLLTVFVFAGCGDDANTSTSQANNPIAGEPDQQSTGQQSAGSDANELTMNPAGAGLNGTQVTQPPMAGSTSVMAGASTLPEGGENSGGGGDSSLPEGGAPSTAGMPPSVSGRPSQTGGHGAPTAGQISGVGGSMGPAGGMIAQMGGVMVPMGGVVFPMGGVMNPINPNDPAMGRMPNSCGERGQNLFPVDCTIAGDANAQCIMGNHCSCSPGYRCVSNQMRPGTRQCDPGSICINDGPDGSRADSCGSPNQGLIPVDCTINGDVNAVCVFGNHCLCSMDYQCEDALEPGIVFAECKPGSVCIPR